MIMKSEIKTIEDITPEKLLGSGDHRLVLRARLQPTADRDRFQPAGFPEIGHVLYDSPQPDHTRRKVCIVDSAASMANHLETVCLDGPFSLDLHPDLQGLPYVVCYAKDEKNDESLVVTTLSEGHRLASSYFTDTRSKIEAPAALKDKNLGEVLLKDEFKLEDLGKRSHPLPEDWWNVFKAIFNYDSNSLVHGILFPAMGIKIPRMLTAQLDAFGAARVATSGVKFDKLLMTTSGQPIFAKDEETAEEIRATFVLDLALVRSFGRGKNGLSGEQKAFLLALALWKIRRMLEQPFRFRSGCDLQFRDLCINGGDKSEALPEVNIQDYLTKAEMFATEENDRVTKVFWLKNEIFKNAKASKDQSGDEGDPAPGEDENEGSGEPS